VVEEKREHRYSLRLTDSEKPLFEADCYDNMRRPSDFLYFLWREYRKSRMGDFCREVQDKSRELEGRSGHGVGADLRGVGRNVITTDDDGFADTVQMR
jgi:hypothetical protein